MKLSEIKNTLTGLNAIQFKLPNGENIPAHFHITEVGLITKKFIDCGGTMRDEQVINFQLWHDQVDEHRLAAEKLKAIIELSERKLSLPDAEIEVEYQSDTIGKYGLDFSDGVFQLTTKQTDCLAKEGCGVPVEKAKVSLGGLPIANSCTPGGGCC